MENKIIIATYSNETAYQIPIDWSLDDIFIRNGVIFYKNMPQYSIEHHELDGKIPDNIYEDAELIRNEGGDFDDHCMNGAWGQLRLPGLEPQKDIYVRAKDGPMLGIRNYTEEELQKYIDRAKQGKANLIFESVI